MCAVGQDVERVEVAVADDAGPIVGPGRGDAFDESPKPHVADGGDLAEVVLEEPVEAGGAVGERVQSGLDGGGVELVEGDGRVGERVRQTGGKARKGRQGADTVESGEEWLPVGEVHDAPRPCAVVREAGRVDARCGVALGGDACLDGGFPCCEVAVGGEAEHHSSR